MKTAGYLYTLLVLLRVLHLTAHSLNLSRFDADGIVSTLVLDETRAR